MELRSIASGSSGNCVYVRSGATQILIDAGYSGRQIEKLLKMADIEPRKLSAILVTHEHSDHIAGVGVLSRRHHIPVYANANTWRAMEHKLGKIKDHDHKEFTNGKPFLLGDMEVLPVPVHHDAADPVGYTFSSGREKISVVTDTGIVDRHLLDAMAGSDIYYFEANYEEFLLMHGDYSPWSKKRIASELGHLSNVQSAAALCELLEGRGEQVLLAHMSINNNTSACCQKTVCDYLEAQGFDTGRDVHVLVAPRYEPSPLFSAEAIHAQRDRLAAFAGQRARAEADVPNGLPNDLSYNELANAGGRA
ncbi:MAG: MBL fold metallo-hydrolase [Peptoniphilaceae bacterium]|nr:MBL fold metallo-hydrolase [Peptoniphilaceae bacterium]MDY6086155.1 MBL fold metallo-hydrolase [Peptoniphilaceae bacterium]